MIAVCLWVAAAVCLCVQVEGAVRPTVRKVVVDGVQAVSETGILRQLITRRGMPVDSGLVRRDALRILEVYRDAGFWQAAVRFPEIRVMGGEATVRFRVIEGARTRIDSVCIAGQIALPEREVLGALNLPAGTPLVSRRLNRRLDALLSLYENSGYPFCALRPDVRFLHSGHAVVSVEVNSGPVVCIDALRFEGNRVTENEVLVRASQLVMNSLYDQRRVDRAMRVLRRLPFLISVDEPIVEMEEGRATLVFRVKEARSARVDGGVGIAPGVGNSGATVTGGVSLDVLNFAGRGRQGHLSWGRTGPAASDLRVTYREPWVLGAPFGGQVEIETTERPGFAEQRVGLGIDAAIAQDGAMRLAVWRSRVLPDSVGLGRFLRSDAWRFSVGGQIDRRDDAWNPRRGWQSAGDVSVDRVSLSSGMETRWRSAAEGQLFVPAGSRWVLAFRANGAVVMQAGSVSEDARIRLGGASSIRGYREEAFWARRALWGSVEWRYVMGMRSRLFAFVDLGVLTESQGHLWPLGYGMGLLADSRMGTVGLVFGLARGDSPGQGKVHVRLAQAF